MEEELHRPQKRPALQTLIKEFSELNTKQESPINKEEKYYFDALPQKSKILTRQQAQEGKKKENTLNILLSIF